MGITIHYRGRLDDLRLLPKLCDELTDIASTMNWPSTALKEDWNEPANPGIVDINGERQITGLLSLKGIQISPHPKCEPLNFFFDAEGNLRSPIQMVMISEGSIKPEDAWVFVKTQFSSPDTHIWILGLLKYLKKHYISNLEVSDEGDYWERGNRKNLEDKMRFIDEKLQYISNELSSEKFGSMSGLSTEEIAAKIEALFRNKSDKN